MSADLWKEFGQPEENRWKDVSAQVRYPSGEAEEDFGDFEEAEQEKIQIESTEQRVHSHASRLGEGAEEHSLGEQWGNFEDGTVLFDVDEAATHEESQIQRRPSQSILTAPVLEEDDDFDPWEPVSTSSHTMTEALSPHQSEALPSKKVNETSSQHRPAPIPNEPPPANVPPPSILLLLSATVLHVPLPTDSVQGGKMSEAVGQRLTDMRAISRVVAGRKQRWKRDNILSQSMKIGQAGKQGGMKLTSVDKTESRREDQEVSEVLRVWKEQVGVLRSIVLAVQAAHQGIKLAVPEVTESAPVLLAKAGEGALTATKACFLCGLGRNERVSKIDVNVEDSFGEWWVEHWGHLDCTSFWTRHKSQLPQK
ncbi:uncharacterized protein KY384_001053 [Bacidia gigantensis]|uniref:uncharacterized protein n=1 Tax=Bacidia gigantensis TaxID=2732470 RepID=UPI001D03D951|nr:uncharacterized protein KY384_001053 [Bacidia gigantensis]KAG8534209.1 hypothetical protein KY384_001053 [Bacidia gigantensis]